MDRHIENVYLHLRFQILSLNLNNIKQGREVFFLLTAIFGQNIVVILSNCGPDAKVHSAMARLKVQKMAKIASFSAISSASSIKAKDSLKEHVSVQGYAHMANLGRHCDVNESCSIIANGK